jgi:hypothetical protein
MGGTEPGQVISKYLEICGCIPDKMEYGSPITPDGGTDAIHPRNRPRHRSDRAAERRRLAPGRAARRSTARGGHQRDPRLPPPRPLFAMPRSPSRAAGGGMNLMAKLTAKAALECEQAFRFGLPDARVKEHFERFNRLWDAALAEAETRRKVSA